MERDLYLAAYDVRHPKRLRLALKILKDYSTGGQKSVFECFLTPGELRQLTTRVRAILAAEDRFLLLRLNANARFITLGVAIPPQNPNYFYFS